MTPVPHVTPPKKNERKRIKDGRRFELSDSGATESPKRTHVDGAAIAEAGAVGEGERKLLASDAEVEKNSVIKKIAPVFYERRRKDKAVPLR